MKILRFKTPIDFKKQRRDISSLQRVGAALMSKLVTSATYRVLEKILSQEVVPLYSQEILDEYNEVLRRKKFGIQEDELKNLLYVI